MRHEIFGLEPGARETEREFGCIEIPLVEEQRDIGREIDQVFPLPQPRAAGELLVELRQLIRDGEGSGGITLGKQP
jgi:hypothetical protein